MAIYQLKNWVPEIGEGCFIAESADIIGKVVLKDNSSIWNQCVARGDIELITIGAF